MPTEPEWRRLDPIQQLDALIGGRTLAALALVLVVILAVALPDLIDCLRASARRRRRALRHAERSARAQQRRRLRASDARRRSGGDSQQQQQQHGRSGSCASAADAPSPVSAELRASFASLSSSCSSDAQPLESRRHWAGASSSPDTRHRRSSSSGARPPRAPAAAALGSSGSLPAGAPARHRAGSSSTVSPQIASAGLSPSVAPAWSANGTPRVPGFEADLAVTQSPALAQPQPDRLRLSPISLDELSPSSASLSPSSSAPPPPLPPPPARSPLPVLHAAAIVARPAAHASRVEEQALLDPRAVAPGELREALNALRRASHGDAPSVPDDDRAAAAMVEQVLRERRERDRISDAPGDWRSMAAALRDNSAASPSLAIRFEPPTPVHRPDTGAAAAASPSVVQFVDLGPLPGKIGAGSPAYRAAAAQSVADLRLHSDESMFSSTSDDSATEIAAHGWRRRAVAARSQLQPLPRVQPTPVTPEGASPR